jgi:hypothetical protein
VRKKPKGSPRESRSKKSIEGGHEVYSVLRKQRDGFFLSQLVRLESGEEFRLCTIDVGGRTLTCACPAGKRCDVDLSNPDRPRCLCV